ncbi:MAG TPA: MFS transporter, partial [Hyphomicrobiaceae bacterium]|nr:MFS transporter [Hyphomicrobiaceae bacterium]
MSQSPAGPTGLASLLRRIAHIERGETPTLIGSFAFFFCVLAAYYVIRPVREEMAVRVGREWLQALFVIVFLVMVAAVPLFGWVVSRFAKRRIVPVVYLFFIGCLAAFWLAMRAGLAGVLTAGAFFVWVSVFNLFAVSLFWSVMADTYTDDQAKRLYGLIAAGGSAGAICGPLITQSLVHALGSANLLLVSAGFLVAALAVAQAMRGTIGSAAAQNGGQDDRLAAGGILAGARNVWRSPYLLRIALWVLIANLISTYFYFEQTRIVGAAFSIPADRVQLFARMDLTISVLTVLAQLLVTGALLRRLGAGLTAATLPATAIAGIIALAVVPSVAAIAAVMVLDRTVAFAFANPALRTLFTVVPAEDKYKAQNFIDTVVFRGGDAASGWLFGPMAKALGVS